MHIILKMKIMLFLSLIFISFCMMQSARAAYTPAQLALKLTVGMSTCDVGLATPAGIYFPTLSKLDLSEEAGHVSAAGNALITLNLTNCPTTSKKTGVMPAIKLQGEVTATSNDRIFRDYSSTAGGNIGFGVRYVKPGTLEPDTSLGKQGGYLTSGDYIDLADVGNAPVNQDISFIVDVIHSPVGDNISSGTLKATLHFMLAYH
jgi:hypothetical protein